MGIAERKGRERAEREQRITAAARLIAENEGWSAVTIRRLADEIEYSQPVLYAHFENRDAIVAAVAVEGFGELAAALRQAAHESIDHQGALESVAMAYLAFARAHPALYEAMFTMATGLRFAEADTRPELKDAFAALAAAVGPARTDVEVATETFWAALHGLADLERSGRIRQGARAERVRLVVNCLVGP
ncbi:TetR/AcrR family transcriptional regulator [Nitrospirillum sp. BR 11164]|uniref:TetR/AcrR family transcriptional regulator n=1 Tax=Nitrospirillum sp. BR 11164 TaxID=3104324 RepID=UPI002AFF89CA|nr:TetR/AcrR family transcriptional regulator [Nitrospirillum sp. BR 11164]MEA1648545.1 TetR/AcrR family transcriptional regulator [Nitrospirillum sp. BR 11164]